MQWPTLIVQTTQEADVGESRVQEFGVSLGKINETISKKNQYRLEVWLSGSIYKS